MKKQCAEIVVEQAIIDGFTSLSSALQWFWPASLDKNNNWLPIQENTVLTYIGASLLKKDFIVFNEVQIRANEHTGRMDMIALNFEKSICMYIEGKGDVYANDGSQLQIKKDLERVMTGNADIFKNHQFTTDYKLDDFEHKFAVLLTTCVEDKIRDWWEGDNAQAPEGARAEGWKEFHALLTGSRSRWSIPLRSSQRGAKNEDMRYTPYGLYALFER